MKRLPSGSALCANNLLKKGATAGLPSSVWENFRKNTAGQASSGTQTPRIPLFQQAANAAVILLLVGLSAPCAAEPPAIHPFGQSPSEREDAVPGYVELSDGSIHPGLIYLTRDKRLQVYDQQVQRQREIPLRTVQRIECTVKREWIEREWKFKETTSDEKMYTGRSYPAREYLHTITLSDGRTITSPLSAIVYVEPQPQRKPEQFLLNKRAKGKLGQDLKSLVYVKRIQLGNEAMEEGRGVRGGERGRTTDDER